MFGGGGRRGEEHCLAPRPASAANSLASRHTCAFHVSNNWSPFGTPSVAYSGLGLLGTEGVSSVWPMRPQSLHAMPFMLDGGLTVDTFATGARPASHTASASISSVPVPAFQDRKRVLSRLRGIQAPVSVCSL